MRVRHRVVMGAAVLAAGLGAMPVGVSDAGPFVRALWLVQRFGTAEAVKPSSDASTKAKLAKALGKDGRITAGEVQGLIDPTTFARLAGSDETLDPSEVQAVLETTAPASRQALNAPLVAHAEALTTGFDRIDPPHREAGALLVDWILKHHQPGQLLHVTVVCTGNSRRSILGATMGNIAAAYYGLPEIRFHSGGTAPSAFNPRTVAALQAIGVEIEPTGAEAARGEPDTANPVYRVRWGQGLETTEFSKTYRDPANPQAGFAALLVCTEADAACPVVQGASARIKMPYLDPKLYDGSPFEAAKYAERRDDIGRLMLSVMMQVRNRLDPSRSGQ